MSHTVDAAAAWIYRGVWASIVALFRVPPEPPTLPSSGETVHSIRPSAGYLRYLKFLFWIAFLPGDIAPILIWLPIAIAFPIVGVILVVPLIVVLIAPDVIAYVGLHLRYDTTWYVFTDRSLRIRRGIWVIHETTITFENVQNVEVAQGPVQRYFGIADVIVQTAGGGAAKKTSRVVFRSFRRLPFQSQVGRPCFGRWPSLGTRRGPTGGGMFRENRRFATR